MADTESTEVFILTTETLQGYDGDIVRFPQPVFGVGHGDTSLPAYEAASDNLRENAKKIGANVVIGAKFGDAQWSTHTEKKGYWVRVSGTPAYLSPPLIDPHEYMKNLKDEGLA